MVAVRVAPGGRDRGGLLVRQVWDDAIRETREEALQTAMVVEASLSTETIRALAGRPADPDLPEYQCVTRRLADVGQLLAGVRSVYLVGIRDETTQVLAGSEPPESPWFLPPGSPLPDPDGTLMEVFRAGVPAVTPSLSDRWGDWVRVLVPVEDPSGPGAPVVLVMEYPASTWSAVAVQRTRMAGMILAVVLLLLVAFYVVASRGLALRESRQEYQRLREGAHDIVFRLSEDGRFEELSPSFTDSTGHLPEEVLGRPCHLLLHPDDRERFAEMLAAARETGEMQTGFRYRVRHLDGSWRYRLGNVTPLRDSGGFPAGFLGVSKDITDDVRSRQELRDSEDRLRALVENMPAFVTVFDGEGRYLELSPSAALLMGKPRGELLGRSFGEILPPETAREFERTLADLRKRGKGIHKVDQLRVEGTKRYMESWIFVLEEREGSPVLFGSIGIDVTGQREAEQALEHSRDLMRYIIENSRSAVAVHDRDLRYIYVSRRYLEEYRVRERDLIGRHHYEVFPDLPVKWRQAHRRALEGEVVRGDDDPFPRADGTVDWTRWECRPWYQADGQVGGIVVYTEVITRERAARLELERTRDYLENLIDKARAPIIVWDSRLTVQRFNAAAELLTGRTLREVRGRRPDSVFPAGGAERFSAAVFEPEKRGELAGMEMEVVRPDGEVRHVLWSTTAIPRKEDPDPLSYVSQGQDITERIRAERELSHASLHDLLTGVRNRRYLEGELDRIVREGLYPAALVMGDVDGLRVVNESFGHAAGDQLLREAARVFREACRPGDTVARTGGDEFVVLLPRGGKTAAQEAAARIRSGASGVRVSHVGLSLTLGTAVMEEPGSSVAEILSMVEHEMYSQKIGVEGSFRSQIIGVIMNTLFEKSPREMRHSERVGSLCRQTALRAGLEEEKANLLQTAGLVHDIGKIVVEARILNKQGTLDTGEWEEMKRHPEAGWRILQAASDFVRLARFVREHHERWDGSGYPAGLAGEEISLEARIIGVVDAYDAMTSYRSYRRVLSRKQAVAEICRCAGTQFDPGVARVFVEQVLSESWPDPRDGDDPGSPGMAP